VTVVKQFIAGIQIALMVPIVAFAQASVVPGTFVVGGQSSFLKEITGSISVMVSGNEITTLATRPAQRGSILAVLVTLPSPDVGLTDITGQNVLITGRRVSETGRLPVAVADIRLSGDDWSYPPIAIDANGSCTSWFFLDSTVKRTINPLLRDGKSGVIEFDPSNAPGSAQFAFIGTPPSFCLAFPVPDGAQQQKLRLKFGHIEFKLEEATPPRPVASPTGVFTVGGGVAEPQPTYTVLPEYSDEGRRARIQGTVELLIIVNADGSVQPSSVRRSLGYGLDEKAIEAVKKWNFTPGKKDGVPVPTLTSVSMNFSLR
jgi:TonB family protein